MQLYYSCCVGSGLDSTTLKAKSISSLHIKEKYIDVARARVNSRAASGND